MCLACDTPRRPLPRESLKNGTVAPVAIRIISTNTADHYKWGGDLGTDCDGWHLVKTPNLSVIEEFMPTGTSERRHYHRHARQFFYVLEGVLTLEIEGKDHVLQAGEGIEISPGQPHQAF